MIQKVYVNIPANAVAGGCESLYQLVDAINNVGGYASIIWDKNMANPVPGKYSHYNIKWGELVEDEPQNWVIYPEVWTEKVHTFSNMKKSIWWLSVDNNHNRFKEWNDESITHFYQSYYALSHIQKNGGVKHLYINDYISQKYLDTNYDKTQKQNVVLYNPIKGIDITNQIMQNNTDIEFTPIRGLDENGVIELLKTSKVYIDFGHHPGRDRIPRESAHLGCCVITNKKGSAGFYNDVLVPSKYKTTNIDEVGTLIRDCFDNYDNCLNEQNIYHNTIINQKELLHNLCKQYFL